jgi:hypothetical protein
MSERLKPCPFCGSTSFQIIENGRMWLGQRFGEPSSVSVKHYCDSIEGQPSRAIERIGKDLNSALDAWNMRYKE